jgi:hypothetical protein
VESVKLSSGLGPHVEETGRNQPPFALGRRERGGDFQLPGSLCRPAKPSQVVGQSGLPEMGPLPTDDRLQRGQPVLRALAHSLARTRAARDILEAIAAGGRDPRALARWLASRSRAPCRDRGGTGGHAACPCTPDSAPHVKPEPAATRPGKASPSRYHSASTAPPPSPPLAQVPRNPRTSTNPPPARQPRPLKLLALRLSRRFYSPSLLAEAVAADQRRRHRGQQVLPHRRRPAQGVGLHRARALRRDDRALPQLASRPVCQPGTYAGATAWSRASS